MVAFYSFTRFLVWVAIIVGALVGVLRLTVMRWVRLPSAQADPTFALSVMPSLSGGDLIVTLRLGTPSLGDLMLCPEPGAPQRFVIGRIFGEAGDRVRIVNASPEVNGDKFLWERACDPNKFSYVHPSTGESVDQDCVMESVGGGLHKMGGTGGHKVSPENRDYTVPEGSWFLLSDNRLAPYDSRDYGYVPVETCKEKVVLRLVSGTGWSDVEGRLSYIP
jgi:signal peptidase I